MHVCVSVLARAFAATPEHACAALQETAPIPTVEGVYLVTSPQRTRFSFAFGGFATGGGILSNAARLALALTGEGIAFNSSEFYFALYDISRVFGRHNEVLFDSASGRDLQQPLDTS